MKTQQLTAKHKETTFTFTLQVPENAEEFATVTGVPMLDFAIKEWRNRLTGSLKGKVAEGKLKPTDKKALTKAASEYRLVLPAGQHKKELRNLMKDVTEAEAAEIAEAVKKLRQKKAAADQPTPNGG